MSSAPRRSDPTPPGFSNGAFTMGPCRASLDFEGRALVSVRPMQTEPFDLAFRGGYRGSLELEGSPIDVLSVHLANPLDGLTGIRARRAQLDGLEPQIATMRRGVLVGDMNATPSWPAYRRLASRLTDGVADWADRQGVRRPRDLGTVSVVAGTPPHRSRVHPRRRGDFRAGRAYRRARPSGVGRGPGPIGRHHEGAHAHSGVGRWNRHIEDSGSWRPGDVAGARSRDRIRTTG